jgi:hypothetical protein
VVTGNFMVYIDNLFFSMTPKVAFSYFSFKIHTGAGLIIPEIQNDGKVNTF